MRLFVLRHANASGENLHEYESRVWVSRNSVVIWLGSETWQVNELMGLRHAELGKGEGEIRGQAKDLCEKFTVNTLGSPLKGLGSP